MFKKVAFTYYPVTDVARARKFYEETLGLNKATYSCLTKIVFCCAHSGQLNTRCSCPRTSVGSTQ